MRLLWKNQKELEKRRNSFVNKIYIYYLCRNKQKL